MKHHILALSVLCSATLSAFAQTPPANQDKPGGHGEGWKNRQRQMLESIPEELRERFTAAREAAMKDPAIQDLKSKAEEANKAFLAAVRESMVKTDPALADSVQKIADQWKGRKEGKENKEDKKANRQTKDEAIQSLPTADKDKLEAARKIAKQAPAVQSAEAKMKAAQSPEERKTASEEYHQAMRSAILTADPTLTDVLDALHPTTKK
jgi:hypothetical protein